VGIWKLGSSSELTALRREIRVGVCEPEAAREIPECQKERALVIADMSGLSRAKVI